MFSGIIPSLHHSWHIPLHSPPLLPSLCNLKQLHGAARSSLLACALRIETVINKFMLPQWKLTERGTLAIYCEVRI